MAVGWWSPGPHLLAGVRVFAGGSLWWVFVAGSVVIDWALAQIDATGRIFEPVVLVRCANMDRSVQKVNYFLNLWVHKSWIVV